jgi:hypothetical protein
MDFDFTLLANGGQAVDIAGSFFKYKAGIGAIKIQTDRGGSVTLLPGQGVRNAQFTRLQIVDASGLPNSGILIAGNEEFIDDRISGSVAITAGTLSVVDDGKSRTLSGSAFIATIGQSAAAGTYATLQLWNPAGSGKNLIVESINANFDVDNLFNASDSVAAISVQTGNPSPKKLGGAASVAWQCNAAPGAGPAGARYHSDYMSAKKPLQIVYKEPLVIPPGHGFVLSGAVVATITTMYADIEFYEA